MSDTVKQIGEVDSQLTALLVRRLQLSQQLAAQKKEQGLPLYDRDGEDAAVAKAMEEAGDFAEYAKSFMNVVIGLSKRAGNE